MIVNCIKNIFALIIVVASLISFTKTAFSQPVDCAVFASEPASNNDTFYETGAPFLQMPIRKNKYDYSFAIYNPNNKNQIAFVRNDNTQRYKKELWSFDFCTKKLKIITDKMGTGYDWSSKDWLICKGYDNQIWKVKSNGKGLTQLTQDKCDGRPKWNESGTQFIFRRNGELIIADESGAEIDTINIEGRIMDWKNNSITYLNMDKDKSYTLRLFNLETQSDTIINHFSNEDNSISYMYVNIIFSQKNESIFWGSPRTIEVAKIDGNKRLIISGEANNRSYRSMDLSPDEKTFLVTRLNCDNIINDYRQACENLLYLIDIDGTNERKILIPE